MFLVGLTGGIASGKSAVAERLVSRHGVELVDADQIAREVVQPDTPAWKKIVEHFGSGVLDEDGFIDRPRLGAIIFASPEKRTLLNEITHPRIASAVADRLELLQAFDGVVVLDVPLLVEAGMDRGYQAVVVVAAKPEIQVRRLCDDRGLTEAEAWSRVRAQAPLEDKLAVATHVIWNEGSLDELAAAVDEVGVELAAAARAKAQAEQDGIPND